MKLEFLHAVVVVVVVVVVAVVKLSKVTTVNSSFLLQNRQLRGTVKLEYNDNPKNNGRC